MSSTSVTSIDISPLSIDDHKSLKEDIQLFKWNSIQSLVPLVKLLSSCQEYDEKYILAGPATPQSWSEFFQASSEVENLVLNSQDTSKIDPSTYIRIAHELEKGRPLFPSLRTLSIQDLDSTTTFLHLLVSSTLVEVSIKAVTAVITTASNYDPTPQSFSEFEKKAEALRVVVGNFLCDIAQSTPNLNVLRITNTHKIPQEWLTGRISNITKLTTLELKSLPNINNFDDIRALGALTSLKRLSLEVSTLKYDFLPPCDLSKPQESQLVPFLPSLKDLTITGPLKLVLDLIQNVVSEDLVGIDINCTTHDKPDETSGGNDTVHITPLTQKKKGKKKPNQVSILSATPQVEEARPVNMNIISAVSVRWHRTLEELSFNSAVGAVCDLNFLTSFQKLKNVVIDGGNMVGIHETFDSSSACWKSVKTIALPQAVPISFSTLHNIAKAAPHLQRLYVALDIRALNLPKATDTLRPIHHPLQDIIIRDYQDNDDDVFYCNDTDVKWQHIISVARYMVKLFPLISSIKAMCDASEWEKVKQTIQLCQEFHANERVQDAVKGEVISDFEVV